MTDLDLSSAEYQHQPRDTADNIAKAAADLQAGRIRQGWQTAMNLVPARTAPAPNGIKLRLEYDIDSAGGCVTLVENHY